MPAAVTWIGDDEGQFAYLRGSGLVYLLKANDHWENLCRAPKHITFLPCAAAGKGLQKGRQMLTRCLAARLLCPYNPSTDPAVSIPFFLSSWLGLLVSCLIAGARGRKGRGEGVVPIAPKIAKVKGCTHSNYDRSSAPLRHEMKPKLVTKSTMDNLFVTVKTKCKLKVMTMIIVNIMIQLQ